MPSTRWLATLGAMSVALALGCKPLALQNATALPPPRVAPESVGLDTVSVRFPVDDARVNGPLWAEIGEQHLPADVRDRLASNGIRAGVIGAKMPLELEQLLQMKEVAPQSMNEEQVIDLARRPMVQQGYLHLGPGSPGRVVASGQQPPLESLHVFRTVGDYRTGRSYYQAACVLTIKAFAQPGGYVRLQITPEVEHGPALKSFVPRALAFEIELRPKTEEFSDLRMEWMLAPGEMLALSCLPEHKGSLGTGFFVERVGSNAYQKILLIRIAQTKGDSLFDDVAMPSPVAAK